jgi:hypothetical protein
VARIDIDHEIVCPEPDANVAALAEPGLGVKV